MNDSGLRIWLAGAAPDSGNLGCSALCHATIGAVAARVPHAEMTVLDFGEGFRTAVGRYAGQEFKYRLCGAHGSYRVYRTRTLAHMHVSARLGSVGRAMNPYVRELSRAHKYLDISGGDSFTDIYGRRRFRNMCLTKLIALRAGVPLVLLPQTYGPFASKRNASRASEIVRRAESAWARDRHSFAVLKDLLGVDFDPARHRSGVDVAFLLPLAEPRHAAPVELETWQQEGRELVGINVSGLIYNRPDAAHSQFGFRADYRKVIETLIERLITETNAGILLVPHVIAPPGNFESDSQACEMVHRSLPAPMRTRVAVLPAEYDQSEIKTIISRCDWFCGTRMHATVAAISTCTPCAAIAYSPKTLGVFETAGQGKAVTDPRSSSTDDVLDGIWSNYTARHEIRKELERSIPGVKARASTMMDEVLGVAATSSEPGPSSHRRVVQ